MSFRDDYIRAQIAQEQQRSPSSVATIGLPIGIGLGVGIRNLLKKERGTLNAAVTNIKTAVAPETEMFISQFNRLTSNQAFKSALDIQDTLKIYQTMVNRSVGNAIPNAKLVKEAWRLTLDKMPPHLRKGLKYTRNIENIPMNQIISAIQRELETNSSRAMQGVANKFIRYYTDLYKEFISPVTGQVDIEPKFFTIKGKAKEMIGKHGEMPAFLKPYIKDLESVLNEKITSRLYYPPEGYGAGFLTLTGHYRGATLNVNIPLSDKLGLMSEGKYGQTIRVSPKVGILDKTGKLKNILSREEYFMKELSARIGPSLKEGIKSAAEIQKEIEALYQDVFRRQEVVNISQSGLGFPYAKVKAQQINIMKEAEEGARRAFVPVSSQELQEAIIKNKNLFPGTSPQSLAQGRVSLFNIGKLFPGEEAVGWAARPSQMIRDWEFSEEVTSGKIYGTYRKNIYKHYVTPAERELYETEMPFLQARTLYVSPEVHSELLKSLRIDDGEALMNERLSRKVVAKKVKKVRLDLLEEEAAKIIESGNLEDLRSLMVGREKETGNLFKMPGNVEDVSTRWMKDTKTGEEFLELTYTERRRMKLYEKFFGGMKAMTRTVPQEEFTRALKKLGSAVGMDLAAQGFDVIATTDMLRKNRAFHNRQMITELHYSIIKLMKHNENVRKAVNSSIELQGFLKNPLLVAETFAQRSVENGVYNHQLFIGKLVKLAQKANLTNQTMERIFGAVPLVLDKGTGRGIAAGIISLSYGGPSTEMGRGSLGSIEPRLLYTLKGPAFENIGDEIIQDLLQRTMLENPEALTANELINKSIASLLDKNRRAEAAFNIVEEYAGNETQLRRMLKEIVEGGGGHVRIGKGFGDMYIPSSEELSIMDRYVTAQGVSVRTDLYKEYESLLLKASRMYQDVGHLTPEEFLADISNKELAELRKHAAMAGKGIGSVMRGKVTGSRFLTAVSEFGDWTTQKKLGMMHVGVSRKRGLEMIAELESSGLYSKEAIEEIRQRFLGGEAVGALMSRHPIIGPMSYMPVAITKVEKVKGRLFDKDLLAIQSNKTRSISIEGFGRVNIDFGPLVGLAGDKDADRMSIFMAGPNLEKRLLEQALKDQSSFMREYTKHQIRFQLLKSKRSVTAGATIREEMAAAATKLGLVQEAVPRLSIALQETKYAATRALSGESLARAMTLLEWIEQTPIAGKHLSPEAILKGEMHASIEQLISGLGAYNVQHGVRETKAALDEMLKGGVSELQKAVGETIRLSEESMKQLGLKTRELAGFDLEQTLKEIVAANKELRMSPDYRIFKQITGRALYDTTAKEMRQLAGLMERVAGNTEMQVGREISTRAIEATNRLFTSGESVLRKLGAPLALGFTAAVGLSMALSKPEETIGPGANGLQYTKPMLAKRNMSSQMTPETRAPARRVMGNPSAPQMLRQKVARIAPREYQQNLSVSAYDTSGINPEYLGQAIDRQGVYRNASINIMDDRSYSQAHILGNKY